MEEREDRVRALKPEGVMSKEMEAIGLVPAQAFLQAVREVTFAAGEKVTLPILGGKLLFEFRRNGVTLVAADEFRLSAFKIGGRFEFPKGKEQDVIIEVEGVREACRDFFPRGKNAHDREVRLRLGADGLEIGPADQDEIRLAPKIEGPPLFPWRDFVPGPTTGVIFQREALLGKLGSFDSEERVRIEFIEDEEGKKLRLWQGEPGEARIEEFLPVEGELLSRVALQHRFLSDLAYISAEELKMEVNEGRRAIVFRKLDDEDFLYVVAPMTWIDPR